MYRLTSADMRRSDAACGLQRSHRSARTLTHSCFNLRQTCPVAKFLVSAGTVDSVKQMAFCMKSTVGHTPPGYLRELRNIRRST